MKKLLLDFVMKTFIRIGPVPLRKIFRPLGFTLIICFLSMPIGCDNSIVPVPSNSNLKSIEIENLNDEKNSKVVFNLPEGWYAKELIFDKAPNFEFNAEKNKEIKKAYSFEFYNSTKMDEFNQYGTKGLAGEFYIQSYYRDQPESTRFPNHCQVKHRAYTGETVLGQGEIFILDCDLPRELRTEKYSTYDMVYVWIPIENEAFAYNLSISVPLGEKDDDYIEMVKKLLMVNN